MNNIRSFVGLLRGTATALAVGGLLSACGGGGGGSSNASPSATPASTSPVVITDTTAPTVAAQSLDTGAAGGVGLVGVTVDGSASANVPLGRLLHEVLKPVRDATPGTVVVGVTQSFPTSCTNGGSMTTTLTYASSSGFAAGDRVDTTYSNCQFGTAVLSGSVSISIRSADPLLSYVDGDITFNGFTATVAGLGTRMDGTARVIDDYTGAPLASSQLSSNSLTVTRVASGVTRASRTLTGFSYRADFNLLSGDISETFAFTAAGTFPKLGNVSWTASSTQPIVTPGASPVPTSGAVRVVGANGAILTGTVVSGGLQLDLDSNGDNVVDSTRVITWTDLEAEL